jgi:phosphoserine phosphatase
MAEVIAVFDLEGTLYHSGGLLWCAILKKYIGRGYDIGKVILHAPLQIVTALCYKARLTDARIVRRTMTKSLATLLKGFTKDEVSQHAHLITEKYATSLRPDMERVLQHHKLQGHTVVLVSSIFQPYLEAVGQKLGVDVTIGTKLEERSGYFNLLFARKIKIDSNPV